MYLSKNKQKQKRHKKTKTSGTFGTAYSSNLSSISQHGMHWKLKHGTMGPPLKWVPSISNGVPFCGTPVCHVSISSTVLELAFLHFPSEWNSFQHKSFNICWWSPPLNIFNLFYVRRFAFAYWVLHKLKMNFIFRVKKYVVYVSGKCFNLFWSI